MSAPAAPSPALARLSRDLPSVSSTGLVGGIQKVTHTVMAKGAVVITRHDQPTMVLMSVDRYLELERAAAPDLEALTRDFDAMYARMQGPLAARAYEDAFAMTPGQLGAAALRSAGRAESGE